MNSLMYFRIGYVAKDDLIMFFGKLSDNIRVEIDNDKAVAWMQKGAQPTDTVKKLLEISGAMSRYKVAAGKIHTVSGGE